MFPDELGEFGKTGDFTEDDNLDTDIITRNATTLRIGKFNLLCFFNEWTSFLHFFMSHYFLSLPLKFLKHFWFRKTLCKIIYFSVKSFVISVSTNKGAIKFCMSKKPGWSVWNVNIAKVLQLRFVYIQTPPVCDATKHQTQWLKERLQCLPHRLKAFGELDNWSNFYLTC